MRPEWIYSQGLYFEPRAGGEVRIFGVYTNKQTNKKNKKHKTNKQTRVDQSLSVLTLKTKQNITYDSKIIIIMIMVPLPKSTTSIHIKQYKATFMCSRSIAGILFDSVRTLRTTFVLHTTYMCS